MLFRAQTLLRFPALPGDLPDDQEQNEGDHQRRRTGGERSGIWFARASRRVPPRRSWSRPRRSENGSTRPPSRAGPGCRRGSARAGSAEPPSVRTLLQQRRILEVLPDHRIRRADSAPASFRRDGTARSRHPCRARRDAKSFSIVGRIDSPAPSRRERPRPARSADAQ